jgi:hypothetical protein
MTSFLYMTQSIMMVGIVEIVNNGKWKLPSLPSECTRTILWCHRIARTSMTVMNSRSEKDSTRCSGSGWQGRQYPQLQSILLGSGLRWHRHKVEAPRVSIPFIIKMPWLSGSLPFEMACLQYGGSLKPLLSSPIL